jgi:hypothetical protein
MSIIHPTPCASSMPNVLTAWRIATLATLAGGTLAAQGPSQPARIPTTVEMPLAVEAGAPTPDSLVHLVLARFATGTAAAFDSVYPDPLGRTVIDGAAQRKLLRTPGLGRVLWSDASRAVLLITGTVHDGDATGIETGSDETNRVRRLSGLYEAARAGDTWTLARQLPFDTLNYIRAQVLHVDIEPGRMSRIVDTVTIESGSPWGFGARLNNATTLQTVTLDGRPARYALGGGVLWIDVPAAARSRRATLALAYSIPAQHDAKPATGDSANVAPATSPDTMPAYGAMNNTDAWHPFFNYDSGNDFAQLTVTATIPSQYRLTTSVPQTETVSGGVRTVHGTSIHPQFLLALLYDRDWTPVTTQVNGGEFTLETFFTPHFHFAPDTIAKTAALVYRTLVPRFGEPQAPSKYLAVVEDRSLGHSGWAVRMNNAVISGDNATMLDEPNLGPSFPFAHEVSHGWTMNSSGLAANFLQEGWATFCESLVLRAEYGPTAERNFWERMRTSYVTGLDRAGFLGGFEGKQSIIDNPDNGRIHYSKGSWILHQLDYVLGDSTYDRGIRYFIANNGRGPNGYPEFIADMSRAAGRDLTGFIMPWLSGKYIPDVEAHVDGSSVIVTQSQPDVVFDLPLDVAIVSGADTVRQRVRLTSRADTIHLNDAGAVTRVLVDPDHHFLLRRHWGETKTFTLHAPNAKSVELSGNFIAKPIAATHTGDDWTVELPIPEGRYIWLWRVDGKSPSDEETIAAVKSGASDSTSRAGVLIVRPLVRLDDHDAR